MDVQGVWLCPKEGETLAQYRFQRGLMLQANPKDVWRDDPEQKS